MAPVQSEEPEGWAQAATALESERRIQEPGVHLPGFKVLHIKDSDKKTRRQGPLVAQSAKHLTHDLGSGYDPTVCEFKP